MLGPIFWIKKIIRRCFMKCKVSFFYVFWSYYLRLIPIKYRKYRALPFLYLKLWKLDLEIFWYEFYLFSGKAILIILQTILWVYTKCIAIIRVIFKI